MELLKPLAKADFPGATVAYTGTAGNTSVWNAGPQGVIVWSTTPAYVEVGEGAVARRWFAGVDDFICGAKGVG